MHTIKAIITNDNKQSCSKAKQFINTPVIGKDGTLLNGQFKFNFDNEIEPTLCRFVNGFLDGNIYDANNEVIGILPALEYSFGGKEFWTKGKPDGYPAIIQNEGSYEEDWENGYIQEIRNEVKIY